MFRKVAAATVLVAGLSSAAIVSTTAPAAAWMSDGAAAAIGAGAFAAGAIAAGGMASAYDDHSVIYRECYPARRPIYNHLGDVVGFHRVRVCD